MCTLLSTATPTIHIHDLNNNPLVIIPLGKARIKLGYARVIQPIAINSFQEIVNNFDKLVNQRMYNNQLYKLLQNKNVLLQQTFSKINQEYHRVRRWDTIGTVFKWIAGTPDANDLQIINSTMNQLIQDNNNQVYINNAVSGRIQQISKIADDLLQLNHKSKNQHTVELNLLTMLLNIDTTQHHIEELEDAIVLAKHGIPTSRILSIKDYIKMKTFLEKANIHINSYEDLLSKSVAHVITNKTHIIYMLKIPQLSNEEYDYEYVDPLIQNEKKISIKYNYILKNDSYIYEIQNKCPEEADMFVCEAEALQIPDLCVTNLVRIQHADCSYEKVYTTGIIKRINDGTILLNNVNVKLKSVCSNHTQHLTGSFLIQFENCDMYLDNNEYTNFILEISTNSYRPTTGLLVYEEAVIDIPPPEYLTNLTLKHRNMLQHVYLQNESFKWKLNLFGSVSIGMIVIIIITITIYAVVSKFLNKTQIQVVLPTQPGPSEPNETTNETTNEAAIYPDISPERYNEIQKFINLPLNERPIRL